MQINPSASTSSDELVEMHIMSRIYWPRCCEHAAPTPSTENEELQVKAQFANHLKKILTTETRILQNSEH